MYSPHLFHYVYILGALVHYYQLVATRTTQQPGHSVLLIPYGARGSLIPYGFPGGLIPFGSPGGLIPFGAPGYLIPFGGPGCLIPSVFLYDVDAGLQ